jgi:predicted glycoside hydrolase/deacetylase ChbG (UPF0249 family)
MPGFKDAISRATKIPTLGVGLHFNLTYGKPLSRKRAVPSLINNKGLFSRDSSRWSQEHISLELEAQYKRFISAGLRPTHLDSHHHIHIDSNLVYLAMKQLSIREQIPMRINTSITDQKASIRCTDHLILDTYDREDSVNQLLGYLENLQEGITELMCHPGYVDEVVLAFSKWTYGRELELHVFKDKRLIDKMQELDIQLVHFGFVPQVQLSVNNDPNEAYINTSILPDQKMKKLIIRRKRKKINRPIKIYKPKIKPAAKKKRLLAPKSKKSLPIKR